MPTDTADIAPTVVDLFCGAGGLTAGLEAAGWRSVAAVDVDRDCIATLQASQAKRIRIPRARRIYLDGARLLNEPIERIDLDLLRPANAPARWRPDLLAGGPPCQPFSSAGLMKALDDPRGRLFLEFVRVAQALRPRFILFENVAGLVTAKGPKGQPGEVLRLVQESFEDIGFACRFALLNAADYGAPQRRVRLFMIGARDEVLPDFPAPTHSREGGNLFGLRPWVTLDDFLSRQPAPAPDDVVRPSATRERELRKLRPGTGLRASGIVEANRPSGHWGYRQDCFVADPALPSRTIRAASTPDWIRLSDGTLRRLTWRECAGLQGFPPEWEFGGTTASRFRQIGNAVQGDIARAIGAALLAAAHSRRRSRPVSAPWPASFHKRVRYTEMEQNVNGAHREAARLAKAG